MYYGIYDKCNVDIIASRIGLCLSLAFMQNSFLANFT